MKQFSPETDVDLNGNRAILIVEAAFNHYFKEK